MPAAAWGDVAVAPGGRGARAWRFGAIQIAVVAGLGLSYLVSTQWSAVGAAAQDAALWMGYGTALNGPRVAKGFVWAVLLLPLLAQALRDRPQAATRCLVWGLVAGAVLVSLAAMWERWAFTGLSDFASDYRTTALFWEMNVGGATLDGWLALTVPVALWWVLGERDSRWLGAGLVVLAVLAYASFTTFSRGLYLGLAVGVVVLLAAMLRRGAWRVSAAGLVSWVGFAAVFGWLLAGVFQAGGYRGMGAMLGLALAVFGVAPVMALASGRALGGAVLVALVGAAVSVVAMVAVPKGVYLAYGFNAVLLGWALFAHLPVALERMAVGRGAGAARLAGGECGAGDALLGRVGRAVAGAVVRAVAVAAAGMGADAACALLAPDAAWLGAGGNVPGRGGGGGGEFEHLLRRQAHGNRRR